MTTQALFSKLQHDYVNYGEHKDFVKPKKGLNPSPVNTNISESQIKTKT